MHAASAPVIRVEDVTDYLDWERPDMSVPYQVVYAPYGETVTKSVATEAEALAIAAEVAALEGTTYMTSHGEAEAWCEVSIILATVRGAVAPLVLDLPTRDVIPMHLAPAIPVDGDRVTVDGGSEAVGQLWARLATRAAVTPRMVGRVSA